jgi:hypothetical protein
VRYLGPTFVGLRRAAMLAVVPAWLGRGQAPYSVGSAYLLLPVSSMPPISMCPTAGRYGLDRSSDSRELWHWTRAGVSRASGRGNYTQITLRILVLARNTNTVHLRAICMFDPSEDPHVAANQARAIDSAIDQYNDAIADVVNRSRSDISARGILSTWLGSSTVWLPTDISRTQSRARVGGPHTPLPPELVTLNPDPDSRFFSVGPTGRLTGGLLALDGW